MSHPYKPSPTGNESVDREMERLQFALNAAQPAVYMQVLHAEPARVKAGMVCYFDGVDFNPGSGEGLYRYTVAGSWAFIG